MNEMPCNENRYTKGKYIKQAQAQTRNEYHTLSRKHSTMFITRLYTCSIRLHLLNMSFFSLQVLKLSSAYCFFKSKISLKYLYNNFI